MKSMNDVIQRHPDNPIIPHTAIDGALGIYNGGFTTFNGQTLAVLRVDNRFRHVELHVARSDDGVHFQIDPVPIPKADKEPFKSEECEIYDPRITRIEDAYYITYGIDSPIGTRAGVMVTRDFESYEKLAIITQPNNRNVVLFPEKINGLYVRLDRPFINGADAASVWLSTSPDLVHWGNHTVLLQPRKYTWDKSKLGAGAPPIRTPAGWLIIYHGTQQHMNGWNYLCGAALADLDDPTRIIARGRQYLLAPQMSYEMVGQVPNVVFPCGAVPDYEKDQVRIYYGGADTCTCLATAKISDLIDFCHDR
jgi:beta-1,4-mannooligosaccharide/beta-1,4-mannosyl-N-acetylglucosamine phosphorylase